MPYSDYFALREGYHAVTSKESMEDPQNHWQDTYPHETFVALLRQTARMLARPDSNAKKPIWIHGIYGTGKSRVAWTLRELLTCPPAVLEAYFNDYKELKDENELRQKLLGLKNGDKIVVAMRYSSSEIQNLDQLVVAIYQSVSKALTQRGMNPIAEKSLVGGICAWLEDEVNQNILTQILAADSHIGDLPKTGAEVREKLLGPIPRPQLLQTLLRIARERHLLALAFNIDSLTAWLEEVIAINNLTALVFIWDEFSDFLRANRNIYGEFQKLAQVSAKIPFYFILVTHATTSLFFDDDPAARVMLDRFNTHIISLPDYTAFKLIGYALKMKQGMEEEWRELREDLNSRLEEARRQVSRMVPALRPDDFKDVLPFHPYAALILKNVAAFYDSNQRSMFDFIAMDEKDLRAFQYFIHKYGPEDAEILSIDHLWDYFYVTGKGKLGTGRDNLQSRVRAILDAYPLLGQKYNGCTDAQGMPCDSPEQRVLKTIIILQALRASSPNAKIFEATEENLETAFYGIDQLSDGKGREIANSLVKEHILFVDQGIYQIPMGNAVNQTEIQKLADNLRKNADTFQLVGSFDIWDSILPPSVPLQTRLSIRKLAIKNFRRDIQRLIGENSKSWAPKVAMLFARNGSEADIIRQYLQEARQDQRANNILFIDAAFEPMPAEKWEDYVQARARQMYFKGKDEAQSRREEELAEGILRDWAARISRGKFALHMPGSEYRICPTADDLVDRLKSFVLDRYPGCCDFREGVKDPFFRASIGQAVIAAGMKGANWSTITSQCAEQLLDGIRVAKYWEIAPDHPLSGLKKALEAKARRAFAPGGAGRLAISEIVDDFLKKGFMPVSLYAWLSGYLLKEYASQDYRYSDGEIGDVMTPEKLAQMLEAAFRRAANPESRYREQYIEVLTEEQRLFAGVAARLFNLAGNEGLPGISAKLGAIVRNWGYPLWVLHYTDAALGLEDFIDLFTRFLNPEANGGNSYGDIASEIGRLLKSRPEGETELGQLFTQENLIAGMRRWLDEYRDGELPRLAAEIGVNDLLGDVRDCFAGDRAWLWNRNICEEAVNNVLKGYSLAAESARNGFVQQSKSREECLAAWAQKMARLHLPSAILRERYPNQKQVLKILEDIARGRTLNSSQLDRFYQDIKEKPDILKDIFANVFDVFKTLFANILKDFTENDIQTLYSRLPASSFYDERQIYEDELKVRTAELAGRLKRGKLADMWRKATGTDSPRELSNLTQTPLKAILMEIMGDDCQAAIMACATLDNGNAGEKEIEQSLAFFAAHSDLLGCINDHAMADKAFMHVIIGKCGVILKDAAMARQALKDSLGADVHSWLENPKWQGMVEKLAETEYRRMGRDEVIRKIADMDPAKAKEILRKLGENNFEVGMRILSEQT